MSRNSFQFSLVERLDANNEAYLIGSSDLPVMVDLREVTFLVFYPEEGNDKATLMIRSRNTPPRVPRTEGVEVITRNRNHE